MSITPSTALVLCAGLAVLGLLGYLDPDARTAIVGGLFALATATMPAVVRGTAPPEPKDPT